MAGSASVAKLQGDIYDASFSSIRGRAMTFIKLPSSYSLISESGKPPRRGYPSSVTVHGRWSLARLRTIFTVSGPCFRPDYAVGDKGTILLFSGNAWTSQSSGTEHDLRAISGRDGDDIWAVGEKGTVLHFAGGGWNQIDAPNDNYRDVATAEGQPLYVVGETRIRRYEDGQWSIEGPAWVQGITSIALRDDGRLAAVGTEGRLFLREANGQWSWLDTPTSADLRDVVHLGDEIIAVGEKGAVLTHKPASSTDAIPGFYGPDTLRDHGDEG